MPSYLRKNIIFTLIFIGIVIVFLCGLGEACVRLFSASGYRTPGILKSRSLRYMPSLFSRNILPQEEQDIYFADSVIRYHISKKGYRGNDFLSEKPKDTVRILIYGGSAAFDTFMSEGDDWPHKVEKILKENNSPNIEVINAGIPGHASFDSFGRLFAADHIFSPDYVVLYNAWNDIKYFHSDEPLLRQFRPYSEESNVFLNYQGPVDRFLCEHSQFYVRLRERFYMWRFRVGPEGEKPEKMHQYSQISATALKQYKLNIEMFVDLARNIGAVPILMTQARLVAYDNTESQKARINYDYVQLTHKALCEAFEKTDEIIRKVAEEKKVSLIDASEHLSGKETFFVDHVHLTAAGGTELAKMTAKAIAELLQ